MPFNFHLALKDTSDKLIVILIIICLPAMVLSQPAELKKENFWLFPKEVEKAEGIKKLKLKSVTTWRLYKPFDSNDTAIYKTHETFYDSTGRITSNTSINPHSKLVYSHNYNEYGNYSGRLEFFVYDNEKKSEPQVVTYTYDGKNRLISVIYYNYDKMTLTYRGNDIIAKHFYGDTLDSWYKYSYNEDNYLEKTYDLKRKKLYEEIKYFKDSLEKISYDKKGNLYDIETQTFEGNWNLKKKIIINYEKIPYISGTAEYKNGRRVSQKFFDNTGIMTGHYEYDSHGSLTMWKVYNEYYNKYQEVKNYQCIYNENGLITEENLISPNSEKPTLDKTIYTYEYYK